MIEVDPDTRRDTKTGQPEGYGLRDLSVVQYFLLLMKLFIWLIVNCIFSLEQPWFFGKKWVLRWRRLEEWLLIEGSRVRVPGGVGFFSSFFLAKKINTIFELRIRIVLHFKKPKRCNACDYVVKGEVEGVAYRDCARANVEGGVGGVRPYAR